MLRNTLLAMATLIVGGAACASPTEPPEPVLPSGAFVLQSVEGVALPFPMVDHGSVAVHVVSRTLELRESGRFVDRMQMRVSDVSGTAPLFSEREGTFEVDGLSLRLVYAESGRASAAVLAGDDLLLDDRGLDFLLRR